MSKWEVKSLGELTVNFDSRRKPIKSSDRRAGEFPYYGASGIVDYVDGYLFDGEYLLVSEDGENLRTRTTPIGFIASGKFWVNNHAHVVKGNDHANTRFLSYLLAQTEIAGYLTGSTQPKLSRRAFDSIKLHVPPRHVQDAIAEVLGALDDKIAANTSTRELLWDFMEASFSRIQRDAESRSCLGDVLRLNYGKALPTSKREPGRFLVVGSGGVSGRHSKSLADGPGVVVGRKGSAGTVHWVDEPHWVIDTAYSVVPAMPEVGLVYSYFLLRSLPLAAMNNDSAVPGLNRAEAYALPVRISRPDNLRDFTFYTKHTVELARRLQHENLSLVETRDVLLPQLMSGKLRVRDAEKVVSDAI